MQEAERRDDGKKPAWENVPALRLHLRKDRNISDIPAALQEWLAGIKDYKGEPFLKECCRKMI